MEFKGTKGKWKVFKPSFTDIQILVEGRTGALATIGMTWEDKYKPDGSGHSRGESVSIREANAQLIAAAPELLDALSRLLDSYKSLEETMYGQGLTVNNWHQNIETEPVDNFFDENINPILIEEAQKIINKALGKEADNE